MKKGSHEFEAISAGLPARRARLVPDAHRRPVPERDSRQPRLHHTALRIWMLENAVWAALERKKARA